MTENNNAPKTREEVVKDVFSDFKAFIDAAVQNDWPYEPNKTFEYGRVDQSHLSHILSGVQSLFTLYSKLPEDHFFVDEQMLRETIALYSLHDYHKIREFGEENFDITETEANLLIEQMNLNEISEIDAATVRSIMVSHHSADTKSKKNEVPLNEYMDHFAFVRLADFFASADNLEEAMDHLTRTRAQEALEYPYTMFGHSLGEDPGEFGNVVNRSVMTVMEDMGFLAIRVYSNGVVYVQPPEVELETDNLHTKVVEEVREQLKKARDDYALEEAKTASLELVDQNTRYFDVGFRDLLFRGVEDTVKGVIKQSLNNSRNAKPNSNAPEGESYAIPVPVKRTQVDVVEGLIDIKIHKSTRRVEGLSQGVHTIRRQFVNALIANAKETKEEPLEEWEKDPLMATLKLFGLYEDEEVRTQIETLREKGGERLIDDEKAQRWLYKFPIAQYVYEKYYTGLPPEELADKLTEIVLENLEDFISVKEYEELILGHIKSELAEWVGMMVKIHPNSDTTNNLAHYRDNKEIAEPYLHVGNKSDCELCGWGTTAEARYTPILLDSLESDKSVEIETNITGAGQQETMELYGSNSHICYACQLEMTLRRGADEKWGEQETVYAHIQPDYSYNPLSAWVFNQIISDSINHNNGDLELEPLSDTVINHSLPDSIEKLLTTEKPSVTTALTTLSGAFSTETPYGGRAIPIASSTDTETLFNAVSVVAVAAVYSGLRVHVDTMPVTQVEYNTGELVSISESLAGKVPFTDGRITLKHASSYLRNSALTSKLKITENPDKVAEETGVEKETVLSLHSQMGSILGD